MNESLQSLVVAAANAVAAYELVQKHKVISGKPGWLNYHTDGLVQAKMCSERDSPLELFVLPAPGQPELARLICGGHLCRPGSRSVHGSIHSCVIGRLRFARRGHPKYCLGCLARSRKPPSVNESQRELAASSSNKLPGACQASQFRVGSPVEAL